MPTRAVFRKGVLPSIPQSEEDLSFGRKELEDRCGWKEYYEELREDVVQDLVWRGHMVSSAFVHWEGATKSEGKKGRFVQDFHLQSKQWEKKGTRMEKKEEFALFRKGDHLLSFDVRAGYRHFSLHEDMRNVFLFQYDGRYFRCKALSFGWGRSAFWLVNLLKPLIRYIREGMGLRVFPYIDDFLIAASAGRVSEEVNCWRVSMLMDGLLQELGLERHQTKGAWGGGRTRIKLLGVVWDTERKEFSVTLLKVDKIRGTAKDMLGR